MSAPVYREDHERPTGIRELLEANPMTGPAREGGRRFWTMAELKTLREVYPSGGIKAAVERLPGRSASAIYNRVQQEGLRKRNGRGGFTEYRRWKHSPQIDDAIRRVYHSGAELGTLKALAQTLGRPRSWLSLRARQLGLSVPRFKEMPWSDREIAILHEREGQDAVTVTRALRIEGFKRSAVAVNMQRKRHNIARSMETDAYTCASLAECFGVDRSAVSNWIDRGLLEATRRRVGGDRPELGQWRIKPRAVKTFVTDNVATVNFHKVDKVWLVELLTRTFPVKHGADE